MKTSDILRTAAELDFMMNSPAEYAARQAAEMERCVAKVESRAVVMCAQAVGRKFRVRINKNTVVGGVIVEAAPHGVSKHTHSVSGTFRIVMKCGENETLREFFVAALPQ